MSDIVPRIDALLANTPESEIEEFEVCRCLRDAKVEIARLRLTDAEQEAVECGIEAIGLAPSDERTRAFAATLRGLLERTQGGAAADASDAK